MTNQLPKTIELLPKLDRALAPASTLLILLHDYPDPDAIASGFLFAHLARHRYRLRTRVVYGGLITRAENKALVRQLKMHMTHRDRIQWRRYKHVAMLDTQPEFGNHGLPEYTKPIVVIDHHAGSNAAAAPGQFRDVRTEYGTCATILLEYLEAAELPLTTDLATALAYAIRAETQELGRDAAKADIEAYLGVYPRASVRKLYKITNPSLPHDYFLLIKRALGRARVFRHIVHVHLGDVTTPEVVSLAADMLLRHERVGWTLATGRYDGMLFLSLRTNHPKAHAGKILRSLVGRRGSAGGHKAMAGGQIIVSPGEETRFQAEEKRLADGLVRKLGYRMESGWRALFEEDDNDRRSPT